MTEIRPVDRILLATLARRHGLEDHTDAIAALALPAARAVALGHDDYSRVGMTRFGGDPDLPRDVSWPRCESGPLPGSAIFIAQLELAALPFSPPGLPRDGLLSLFVQGTDAANVPVDVHALHFRRGASLERRRSPSDLCDEDLADLRPARVAWEPTVCLADLVSSGLADRLEERWEALDALAAELGGGLGRVGGHARDHLDGDLRLSAVLQRERRLKAESIAMFGDPTGPEAPRKRARDDDAAWWYEHRERLLAERERWHCVLRVDSNAEMGLAINDADPLFFLAHEDDLKAGRFDRVLGRVLQG